MDRPSDPPAPPTRRSEARERLLATASGIFYAEGIHRVGVDRIVSESRVTKATFYRHFRSKEALVEAYLLGADAAIRASVDGLSELTPLERLRAIAGTIGTQLCSPGFRGCAFINAASEYPDVTSPVHVVVSTHRAWFLHTIRDLFADAGHPQADGAARHYVMLRDGAMTAGHLGDPDIARETLTHGVDGIIGSIDLPAGRHG